MTRIVSRGAVLTTSLPDSDVASAAHAVVAAEFAVAAAPASVNTSTDSTPAPATARSHQEAPAATPGTWVVNGDSAADPAASAAASVTTAATPLASAVTASTSISTTRPTTVAHVATPAALPQSPANAGSIGGAVFALIVVVGLILALAWLARRMPGLGGAGTSPALRIVGSLALGPRERVIVVAVGDTQLLLGVGAGGTRTLHTLSAPLPVAGATTPAFAQLLAQHFGKKA